MPRIDPMILDSVFYLYETEEDAKNGTQTGGTGFFVGVRSEAFPERSVLYAVTCKHIVKPKSGLPAPVIRLNTRDGKFDVISLTQDDWHTYEEIYPGKKHDIAIYEFGDPQKIYKYAFALRPMLLSKDKVQTHGISPGVDVFMVGRYIDHDGVQRNLPSVRFGNISMMPGEPLRTDEGYFEEDSFIVELRTLSGYSGSPVFLFDPHHLTFIDQQVPIVGVDLLLGMLWSEPPQYRYIEDAGRYMLVYSGMSNVLPAWHIDLLLDWEVFKTSRKRHDEELKEENKK